MLSSHCDRHLPALPPPARARSSDLGRVTRLECGRPSTDVRSVSGKNTNTITNVDPVPARDVVTYVGPGPPAGPPAVRRASLARR